MNIVHTVLKCGLLFLGNRKPRRATKKSVRNKWWKFVTLINNPSLVLDSLSEQMKKDGTRGIVGVCTKKYCVCRYLIYMGTKPLSGHAQLCLKITVI